MQGKSMPSGVTKHGVGDGRLDGVRREVQRDGLGKVFVVRVCGWERAEHCFDVSRAGS
jgi:hypothetical protein